jgi:hypothetical protein
VVAFEDSPRWAVEVQPLTDMSRVVDEIGTMQPGGGTNIHPALDEAYRALATMDAKVKHVILLSDGIAPASNWDDLVFRYNQADITLSSIAIGGDADFQLMRMLAETGKGRYYEGNDPFDLPQLVIKETQQVARAAIVEEPFLPLRVTGSPILAGIPADPFPMLRGYVSTTPKPATQIVLATAQGDPLLAEWQYGLGRVVAWTSDAENKWASQWIDWPEFSRFWAQMVKRTFPNPVDPNRQITVVQEGAEAHIVVDAMTEQRAFLNFAQTVANITRPDGQKLAVPLVQSAPGRYEGRFPAQSEGAYYVEVLQRDDQDQVVSNQPGGYVIPYSAEYRDHRVNEQFLEELSRQTGGARLSRPQDAFAHNILSPGQPLDIWPVLMALTALLFFLDVCVRRLRMAWADVRPLMRRARRAWSEGGVDASRVGALLAARHRAQASATAVPELNPESVPRPSQPAEDEPPPTTPQGRSARLLQAKRRARGGGVPNSDEPSSRA